MMNTSSLLFAFLAAFLMTGCASHYYLGYNYRPDARAMNNVSKKVDVDMQGVTQQMIKAIVTYDISGLRDFGAPKILKNTTNDVIKNINESLRDKYSFDGEFEQWKIGEIAPGGLPDFGDNFDIYDFIEAQFTLKGAPGATLKIYVTKVNGVPKVCGFHVFPIGAKPDTVADKLIGGLFPETFDKFHLFGKGE